MAVPRLGQRRRNSQQRVPILRRPLPRAPQVGPTKLTGWVVRRRPDVWDIGPGPWYWQGKPATRPEFITLLVLHKLGWNPRFQTDILGGRRLPGGQVLDIVLDEHQPIIYITVKSYHHLGARASYYDAVEEAVVRSVIKDARVLEVWEKDIDQPGWLEAFLRREVGIRGR